MHGDATATAHRDVKPHNVLLGRPAAGASGPTPGEVTSWRALDPTPVLTDFGSATDARLAAPDRAAAARIEEDAARNSSMPYRAPELWRVEQAVGVTEKTDLFGLGATLFAAVFGYSPFEVRWGDDGRPIVAEVTHLRILNGLKWPPGEDGAAGRTSPAFRELLLQLTHPDPATRLSAPETVRRIDRMLRR